MNSGSSGFDKKLPRLVHPYFGYGRNTPIAKVHLGPSLWFFKSVLVWTSALADTSPDVSDILATLAEPIMGTAVQGPNGLVQPFEAAFRLSAQRFFIISDRRFLPAAVIPPPRFI